MQVQMTVNLLHVFGREGLVAEGGGRIDVKLPALMVQMERIELACADTGGSCLIFFEISLQTFLYVAVQPLRLGGEGGGYHSQCDEVFLHFLCLLDAKLEKILSFAEKFNQL